MQIFVMDLHGGKIALDIKVSATIYDVKAMLFYKTGIKPDQQLLIMKMPFSSVDGDNFETPKD